MASFLLLRHKVRDFSEWKHGYDAHLSKRTEVPMPALPAEPMTR